MPEIDPHDFERDVGEWYFTPSIKCTSHEFYHLDLTLLLELTKRAREVAQTAPMKDMIGQFSIGDGGWDSN